MVEFMRVPGKGRTPTSIEELFGWLPEKCAISVSTDKMVESVRVPGKGRIPTSIKKLFGWVPGKGSNQFEYQKMEESEWVPRKSRIRASIEKLFGWVPKNSPISVSIEKCSNCASTEKKKNPYEYRKTVRVSTGIGSNQCEYRKMEESKWVPGKSRIRASIEKLFGWLPEKCAISVSTEKWSNPCEYREKEESLRVSKNCSGEYRKRVQYIRVPKNWRIRVSTMKK